MVSKQSSGLPYDEDCYLLGPGSLSWRIMRERVLLLGAGRMLILQMANPRVAAGVEQHSGYINDPWARVRHTTDFYLKLVHAASGDIPELRSYLNSSHRDVRGRLASGEEYSSSDPALMLWVHTTVSESVLWCYEAIFGRLSRADRARYWSEQRILALALGIPAGLVPAGPKAWRRYLEDQRQDLQVTLPTFAVWGLIKSLPPDPPRRIPGFIWSLVRKPLARFLVLATRAGLPSSLLLELSHPWDQQDSRRFGRLCQLTRLFVKASPPELRFSTRARQAQSSLPSPGASDRWRSA